MLGFCAAVAAGGAGCLDRGPEAVDLDVEKSVGDWDLPSPELDVDLEVAGRVGGLTAPTDLAFTPEGVLVAERRGALSLVEDGEMTASWDVEGVVSEGESGLLGVASRDDRVFLYHSTGVDNRLVEYDLDTGDSDVVVDHVGRGRSSNGGGLEFDEDGALWLATGYARDRQAAANPARPEGAVLEVDVDEGEHEIVASGLRNPEGLAVLPDGTPVVTDRGSGEADEVNVVYEGGDYGWPVARTSDEYEQLGYTRPLVSSGDRRWSLSGCGWCSSTEGLENRLVVGELEGGHLHVVTPLPADDPAFDADGAEGVGGGEVFAGEWFDPELSAVSHRLLGGELGRLSAAAESPEGELHVLTANRDWRGEVGAFVPPEGDDALVRLSPV